MATDGTTLMAMLPVDADQSPELMRMYEVGMSPAACVSLAGTVYCTIPSGAESTATFSPSMTFPPSGRRA